MIPTFTRCITVFLITTSSISFAMEIINNEPSHCKYEDTVPEFFIKKNLFIALVVEAEKMVQNSVKSHKNIPFHELCQKIRDKKIEMTIGKYVFMTSADAHHRLFPYLTIIPLEKEVDDVSEKHEKADANPSYKAIVDHYFIHFAIQETKKLPKGYEYMGQIMAEKRTAKEKTLENATKKTTIASVPFESKSLAERHPGLGYNIYSDDFDNYKKKMDFEKIAQRFQELIL
ncbi:MAG TPA: hypothetical protein VEK38_00715 [Candidatus Bathyarchaeia archaeon]|nr:hypothetical protein [Candidatus Bathyarchaeia archaeon]